MYVESMFNMSIRVFMIIAPVPWYKSTLSQWNYPLKEVWALAGGANLQGITLSSRRWVMSAENSKQKSGIRMNQIGSEQERSHSRRSVPGSATGITLGNRSTAEQIIMYAPILQLFKRVYFVITYQWFMTVFIHFRVRKFFTEQDNKNRLNSILFV